MSSSSPRLRTLLASSVAALALLPVTAYAAAPTAPLDATTPVQDGAPAQPTQPVVTSYFRSPATTVGWTEAATAPVTGYDVVYGKVGDSATQTLSIDGLTGNDQVDLPDLAPDTQYTVTVIAKNDAGQTSSDPGTFFTPPTGAVGATYACPSGPASFAGAYLTALPSGGAITYAAGTQPTLSGVQTTFYPVTQPIGAALLDVDAVSPSGVRVALPFALATVPSGGHATSAVTLGSVTLPAEDGTWSLEENTISVTPPGSTSGAAATCSARADFDLPSRNTIASFTVTQQQPQPTVDTLTYGITGSATLKTLAKGTVPVSGSANATIDRGTGSLSADLNLAQGTASLKALGFLPVTAKIALAPTTPLTGTLTGSSLTASAKVRVKLPSLSVFGIALSSSATCQSAQVSTIPLASVGAFSELGGGTLAGTFSISNLTGCGALNGLVSSLTSGNGNTIALKLAPTAAGA